MLMRLPWKQPARRQAPVAGAQTVIAWLRVPAELHTQRHTTYLFNQIVGETGLIERLCLGLQRMAYSTAACVPV